MQQSDIFFRTHLVEPRQSQHLDECYWTTIKREVAISNGIEGRTLCKKADRFCWEVQFRCFERERIEKGQALHST